MIFRRLNRSDAERLFISMQANEAGVAADDVVQLELTAASVDGVRVVQPNTSELPAGVGIADAAIANGAFGLVQVYGYRSTSRVGRTDTTSPAGVVLYPVAAQDYLSSVASTLGTHGLYAIGLESMATSVSSDTVSIKVFLHGL